MEDMANNLTDEQALMLSQFSYAEFGEKESEFILVEGYSFSQIKEAYDFRKAKTEGYEIPPNGNMTTEEFEVLLDKLASDEVLGKVTLKAYQNDNVEYNEESGTGFKAYAFEDGHKSYFTFTGSEGATQQKFESGIGGLTAFGTKDWVDNYSIGLFDESEQFKQVRDFIDKNKGDGEIFVTGHSKGGANAAYACSQYDNITGKTFDAPGIGNTLNQDEIDKQVASGLVNYVAKGDIVGVLLFHNEPNIFVETVDLTKLQVLDTKYRNIGPLNPDDPFHYHYTQVFDFDEKGSLMTAERTLVSRIVEDVVKTAYFEFGGDAKKMKGLITDLMNVDYSQPKFMVDAEIALITAEFGIVMLYDRIKGLLSYEEWLIYKVTTEHERSSRFTMTMDYVNNTYRNNFYPSVEFNYSYLETLDRQIKATLEGMKTNVQTTKTLLDNTKNFWKGISGDSFRSQYTECNELISASNESLESVGNLLNGYINGMGENDASRLRHIDFSKLDQDANAFMDTDFQYVIDQISSVYSGVCTLGSVFQDTLYTHGQIADEINRLSLVIDTLTRKKSEIKTHISNSLLLDNGKFGGI